MTISSARKGNLLRGTKINTIAQMLYKSGMSDGKLIFNGLYADYDSQCVPDARCLERNPMRRNEYSRIVYVSKVLSDVPGYAFCTFRDVQPGDVSAQTAMSFGIPFSEHLTFKKIENGEVVFTYQARLSEVFWYDDGVSSEPVEIRANPMEMGVQLHQQESQKEGVFKWELCGARDLLPEALQTCDENSEKLYWFRETFEVTREIHEVILEMPKFQDTIPR